MLYRCGLIVEVRRRRIAALAAGRHRPGPHACRRTPPRPRSCCRWCRTTSSSRCTARAPNEASEPHRAEVKPTGMLGPASLNGWTMSPVRRWKRLMSPHGVFQVPKSAVSLSDAAASACEQLLRRGPAGDVVVDGHARLPRVAADLPPRFPRPRTRPATSAPSHRPAEVPARAAARSARPASPSADWRPGVSSQALSSAGIGSSNDGEVAVVGRGDRANRA